MREGHRGLCNLSLRGLLLAAAASAGFAQAPVNDAWERAIPIERGGFHAGSTAGATPDGSSTCDVGVSLDTWYVYTPETSGMVRVRTRNNFGPDTVLSVHTFDGNGGLIILACDDNSAPPPFGDSLITWTAQAETPYYLRVSHKNGATGNYLLEFLSGAPQGVPPPNASEQTALSIWPGDYHAYTRFVGGPPSICAFYAVEGAWFTYTPKTSGTAMVRTDIFAHYDTALEITENGAFFRCADSSGVGDLVTFPVQAGAQYLIRLASGDGSGGVYGLRLEGPGCVGQTCDDPEPILAGSYLISLVGATPSGSSTCSPSPNDPARYFRYVATADGILNVSTCPTTTTAVQGYAVDTALSLHSGCPADLATELDCSKNSLACTQGFRPQPFVSTPVVLGQQVLIRVSTRADGQLWPIRLEIELASLLASVCFGDGSGAACPCGNTGALYRGCDNSLGTGGARLFATGTASLSSDTLSLVATNAPPTAPILLLRGNALANGGLGVPLADGLLCAGGSTVRLAGAISAAGASAFGILAGQPLSTQGSPPPPGATRWYQGMYRNNAGGFCTSSRANLTNAVQVTWVP